MNKEDLVPEVAEVVSKKKLAEEAINCNLDAAKKIGIWSWLCYVYSSQQK